MGMYVVSLTQSRDPEGGEEEGLGQDNYILLQDLPSHNQVSQSAIIQNRICSLVKSQNYSYVRAGSILTNHPVQPYHFTFGPKRCPDLSEVIYNGVNFISIQFSKYSLADGAKFLNKRENNPFFISLGCCVDQII